MTADEFKVLPDWDKIKILTGIQDNRPDVLKARLDLCNLVSRAANGEAQREDLDETIDELFGSDEQ